MFVVSHISQHCLHDVCFSLVIIMSSYPLMYLRHIISMTTTKILKLNWLPLHQSELTCMVMPLTKSPEDNCDE